MKNGVNSTEELCQSVGDASVVLRRSFDKSRFATKGLNGNLTQEKMQKVY